MAQNIKYLNQSGPFWDWISELEENASKHPFFNATANQPETDNEDTQEHSHGRHGGRRGWSHGRRGGFGGHSQYREPAAPPSQDDATLPDYDEKNAEGPQQPDQDQTPQPDPTGPSHPEHPGHQHGGPHGGPHGAHHGGPHRGGGCRGRRGFGPGPGAGFPHGRGRFPFGGFGGFGGFGSHNGPQGNWAEFCGANQGPMNDLAKFFSQQLGVNTEGNTKAKDKDFAPPCDVFDTADAYVLHISLPGAKKEDVGVNWNADKSELSVAGVIYRPGNEELLKTLAMNEREVGPFERKVRLGSRANPASVNSDAIAAKMEDGVLIVTVPKVEDFVEIKRVDIE